MTARQSKGCFSVAIKASAIVFLSVVGWGLGFFMGLLQFASGLNPKSDATPVRIVASASSVKFDVPELPYTFMLPNGFVPRMKLQHRDAELVPEPWLPTWVGIGVRHRELREDISTMNADALREFARDDMAIQPYDGAIEPFTTADGSPAFEYRSSASKFEIVAFHGHSAVYVYQSGVDSDMTEQQLSDLRNIARTLARSIRFR